jgi:hypothetical protein
MYFMSFHVVSCHAFFYVILCHVVSCLFVSYQVNGLFGPSFNKVGGGGGEGWRGSQICLPKPSATASLPGRRQNPCHPWLSGCSGGCSNSYLNSGCCVSLIRVPKSSCREQERLGGTGLVPGGTGLVPTKVPEENNYNFNIKVGEIFSWFTLVPVHTWGFLKALKLCSSSLSSLDLWSSSPPLSQGLKKVWKSSLF